MGVCLVGWSLRLAWEVGCSVLVGLFQCERILPGLYFGGLVHVVFGRQPPTREV